MASWMLFTFGKFFDLDPSYNVQKIDATKIKESLIRFVFTFRPFSSVQSIV